jgi:type 1 glutamine amidotransferase
MLVVSLTPGFRHNGAIKAAKPLLNDLGDRIADEDGLASATVDHLDTQGLGADTEPQEFPTDAAALQESYDVLVFNSSNDANHPKPDPKVLTEEQESAFAEYIRSGGGYVGIHSASDNQTDGSPYNRIVGATWKRHPPYQEGTLLVENQDHPATSQLPAEWTLKSEWYEHINYADDVNVLCRADTSSYDGATGEDHPMVWNKEVGDGRSFYTALGHHPEQYEMEPFQNHLKGALRWAAGLAE